MIGKALPQSNQDRGRSETICAPRETFCPFLVSSPDLPHVTMTSLLRLYSLGVSYCDRMAVTDLMG